jgi:hypothetical protein
MLRIGYVPVQEVLPSQEEVVRRTEAITRCIQELLISAKDEKVRKDQCCGSFRIRTQALYYYKLKL